MNIADQEAEVIARTSSWAGAKTGAANKHSPQQPFHWHVAFALGGKKKDIVYGKSTYVSLEYIQANVGSSFYTDAPIRVYIQIPSMGFDEDVFVEAEAKVNYVIHSSQIDSFIANVRFKNFVGDSKNILEKALKSRLSLSPSKFTM
ncbi:MAG TPA: hypothetical protein VJ001_06710 [Rhodocyclaceae bacterium]|nr:hypothetical protein [Rhodocyclaceae bacterium]